MYTRTCGYARAMDMCFVFLIFLRDHYIRSSFLTAYWSQCPMLRSISNSRVDIGDFFVIYNSN